jgi:hypothetical protein
MRQNIMFNTLSSGSSLLNGLKAYWKLDETSGTIITDSVYGIGGNIVGNVSVNQTGKLGKAMAFNASTNYIAVPSSSLQFNSSQCSISMWVYINALPSTLGRHLYALHAYSNAQAISALRIEFPDDGAYIRLVIGDASTNTNVSWETTTAPIGASI